MKTAGYLLLVGGFLGAAFVAVLDARVVAWVYFLPIVAAGAVGVYLIRSAVSSQAQSPDTLQANRAHLNDSLERIVTGLSGLQGDAIPSHEMRFEIDRQFREDLMRFADARESIGHLYGLQAYADVMSAFAAGERYLNRVWSASADGYPEEVRAYIVRSLEQFTDARDKLAAL